MLKTKTLSHRKLSRRELMIGGATLPLAAGASKAFGATEMMGVGGTRFNRMKLGGFEGNNPSCRHTRCGRPQEYFWIECG